MVGEIRDRIQGKWICNEEHNQDKWLWSEEPSESLGSSALSYITEKGEIHTGIYNQKDIKAAIDNYNTQEVIRLLRQIDIGNIDLSALLQYASDKLLQKKQNDSECEKRQNIERIIKLITDLRIEQGPVEQLENSIHVCDNIEDSCIFERRSSSTYDEAGKCAEERLSISFNDNTEECVNNEHESVNSSNIRREAIDDNNRIQDKWIGNEADGWLWSEEPRECLLNNQPCDSSLLSYITEEGEIPCKLTCIYDKEDIEAAIDRYDAQEVIGLLKQIDIETIDLFALLQYAIDQRGKLLQQKQNNPQCKKHQKIEGIIILFTNLHREQNMVEQLANNTHVCYNIEDSGIFEQKSSSIYNEAGECVNNAQEFVRNSNIRSKAIDDNKGNDFIRKERSDRDLYTYHLSYINISNSDARDSKNSEYIMPIACCAIMLLTLFSFHITIPVAIGISAAIVGITILMLNGSKNKMVSTELSHVQQPINIESMSNSMCAIAH